MDRIDKKMLLVILQKIAEKIIAEKELLTRLDTAIGDGDHGINMARGFEAVLAEMESVAEGDMGAVLKNTGMKLVSTVGGASGPLYGTAFMKAGKAAKGKMEMSLADMLQAFSAAIEGIKMRGKSEPGEKTMLDALCPAYEAMAEEKQDFVQAFKAAAAAAEKGAEHTKDIIATKGRASYLGERSLGHVDPGAMSATLILKVMAETLETAE